MTPLEGIRARVRDECMGWDGCMRWMDGWLRWLAGWDAMGWDGMDEEMR